MLIQDFVQKFTINPIKDIVPNLKLIKKIDIDAIHHKGCFNCDDKINQRDFESTPWTRVQYCWACKSINVVYVTDRMGGGHTDVVMCYTDKRPGE